MKLTHILLLSISLALLGCKENKTSTSKENIKKEQTLIVDEHTAEVALDWNGTYKGLLPCASCPGILSLVKLNNNKTFEKSDFYLESKGGYLNDKGTFSFTKDGGKIVLKSEKGTTMYAVGENRLVLLDKDGKKVTSELTEMYKLTKLSNNELELTNTPVKGFLTFGHEVATFEPFGSSKVYWINDFKDGRLTKLYHKKTENQSAPYTPVIAELVLKNNEGLREGFAEQYDDVVDVIEIKSVELITLKNYSRK